MRPGKREVDVSMMGGRGSKKEEGPKGWVMGILVLLTSAPSYTDKGNSYSPHYTGSPHTELPAPFVPVVILGAGTEGHRREGGGSTLEHLGASNPKEKAKSGCTPALVNRLHLPPRMTVSSPHTPEWV